MDKEQIMRYKVPIMIALVIVVIAIAFLVTPAVNGGNRFNKTFWALVPPIIAIALALVTKEVYSSLFVGILIGAIFVGDGNFWGTMDAMVVSGFIGSVGNVWNAGIMIFLVILGIIGVLSLKAGGVQAFGRWAETHIKSRVMAQIATTILGICIFVDDYFNCLTVGSVMQPVTDKFKISRAKLAYLIDSTAAPVCIIAPISSWAAAVVGVVEEINGYDLFVQSIGYNFYALLTITMVFAIIIFKVDFGPMKVHEQNALKGDLFTSDGRRDAKSPDPEGNPDGIVLDLILPIFIFLIPCCIIGLIYTGGFFDGAGLQDSFANCNASVGLPYGALIALLLTMVYLGVRKLMTFDDMMDSLPAGFRNMVPAMLILIFAWTLCTMTGTLGAANFVHDFVEQNAEGLKNFLPAIIMLIACGLAFATGTSWGTFGILLPIVTAVFSTGDTILIVGVSACLAGAVFGDHCSPISDTTIMSSTGAGCSHINHVSTQVPYACLVAAVSFVLFIIAGFWQSWIVTVIGIVAMVAIVYAIKLLQSRIDAQTA